MNHTKILITGLICVVVGVMLVAIIKGSQSKVQPKPQDPNALISEVTLSLPIFFYGSTCPHCQEVEAWMDEKQIDETKIIKKEVYNNQSNAQELAKAAEQCGLATDSIGVPFIYTVEKKCLVGTPLIIEYLSNALGIPAASPSAELK